jgi:hypothetical protein
MYHNCPLSNLLNNDFILPGINAFFLFIYRGLWKSQQKHGHVLKCQYSNHHHGSNSYHLLNASWMPRPMSLNVFSLFLTITQKINSMIPILHVKKPKTQRG